MALHYQHSETMTAIKSVTEKIKHNYSSSQYVEVLERMLLNSLTPILLSTNFVDVHVSGIIHHYMENGRRKISNTGKFNLLSRAILFLSVDSNRKPKIYKSLRLERNLTHLIIKEFLQRTSEYRKLKNSLARADNKDNSKALAEMKRIEVSVGYNGRLDFNALIANVSFWHSKYCDFKNAILEKYMRMITMQAQNFYKTNNSNIELGDLIQNYIMYAAKAIDKFDHRQGTLTTYIMNWLNHARNVTASNENGTAFILPPSKRRECKVNNLSVSIEDEDVKNIEVDTFEDLEREEQNVKIRRLARLADPHGYARLSLGINEILSQTEIDRMKKYVIQA